MTQVVSIRPGDPKAIRRGSGGYHRPMLIELLTRTTRLLPLLALLVLPGCPVAADDDDSGDDDDAGDDDSGDDDDSSVVPGCDDAALGAALSTLATWPTRDSCGHFMGSGTGDDAFRVAAAFQVPGTVVETPGMSWTLPFGGVTLPDEVAGVFEVQAGTNLTVYDCEDAIDPNLEAVVVQQWEPVSGIATMTVDQVDGEAWPGGPLLFTGTVQLDAVVVELVGAAGTTCAVPDVTWTSLNLGWLPGR